MSFESPLRMWAHWFTAINPLNSKSDQPLISPYNITPEANINSLTPRSDQHETSPSNILTLSSKQVMRIFKLMRKKLLF